MKEDPRLWLPNQQECLAVVLSRMEWEHQHGHALSIYYWHIFLQVTWASILQHQTLS